MPRACFMTFVALLVGSALLGADQPAPTTQPSTQPAATQPTASLAQLAWLAGTWEGESLSGRLEEVWSPPHAGMMIGAFRLVTPEGRTPVVELETLAERNGGIELRFRHFSAQLEPWESPDLPLILKLVRLDERLVVFEYPTPEQPRPHQPQRVTMTRSGADQYRLVVDVREEGRDTTIIDCEMRRVPARP